ncbi:MAG TPA: phosphodiester glycosidase family protein [bacterium]
MIKKTLLAQVFILVFALGAAANTIESVPVGPGVIYHHEIRAAGPWQLHVLEIDLSNPWIKIESIKAKDQIVGREGTSSMAARSDREAHRIVGAINADFFSGDGTPVGAQVIDGILLKQPNQRSMFAVSNFTQPIIDIVSFSGKLISSNNQTRTIHGINKSRETDELVIYNKYVGSTTGANYWGTEISVAYLTEHPMINDTIYVVAIAKDSIQGLTGHGNNLIPSTGAVISGHGTSSTFLNSEVLVGDTLAFILQLPPVTKVIKELVGGTPRLIRDGIVSVEWEKESVAQPFTYDRHPRTAVGFSQDSTKLFFFVVDGRQAGFSVGMSLFELANYMLEWGVYQGVNLDGGGSSTMVVRSQIMNRPSDGSERPVANALMVVSTAPTGPVASLKISPQKVFVLSGNTVQFSAKGFDEYFNSLVVPADSLAWQCDPQIGSIDAKALFTSGTNQDSGYVIVNQRKILDSAKVYITKIASIDLQPDPIILKIGQSQKITPQARDTYKNLIALSPTQYAWSVSGEIGTISNDGVFKAMQQGPGYIKAQYQTVIDSVVVFVGVASDVVLDNFTSVSNWSLTGLRVDLAGCNIAANDSLFISAPSSGRLGYQLSTGGTSALYLNCSIPISGTPEAVGIYVYGDGKGHWLRGEFQDADGEKFLVNFTEENPGIDWSNSWKYLRLSLANAIPSWSNPNARLNFPMTWIRIYLAETNDSKKNSGSIYFDDFIAHFITTEIQNHGNSMIPETYHLEQNFPNPFNPTTQIAFGLPTSARVKLDIYNIRGEVVSTLLDEQMSPGKYSINFDASQLPSGIYLYRIDMGGFQETKKMSVVK